MKKGVFDTLILLYQKKSSLDSAEEFHEKVNITFHEVESKYYDKIHEEIWNNLPAQLDRTLPIIQTQLSNSKKDKLAVLDIGCSTGLAFSLLCNSAIGKRITSVFLQDTSPAMLKQAEKKAIKWNKKIQSKCGYVEGVAEKFDLIITSSVLHHVLRSKVRKKLNLS